MTIPDADSPQFPQAGFEDILAANADYRIDSEQAALTGRAARGLAVVTCMDSRIDPLGLMGMKPGDAKILRNAGARVTDDVLRTLVLATYLLGVNRVLVMPHTQCKMASASEQEIHRYVREEKGVDIRSLEIRVVEDQERGLAADLTRIRAYPFLPSDLAVGGAIYDVATGTLRPVDA